VCVVRPVCCRAELTELGKGGSVQKGPGGGRLLAAQPGQLQPLLEHASTSPALLVMSSVVCGLGLAAGTTPAKQCFLQAIQAGRGGGGHKGLQIPKACQQVIDVSQLLLLTAVSQSIKQS
jgi:hypothetical protein